MDWLPDSAESDAEHFTAQAFLAYQLQSRGITAADLGVRGAVVVAFQPYIYTTLVRVAGAVQSEAWDRINRLPIAHGAHHGVPVSIAQLPVGAPAAVMYLESLIVGGATTIIAVGAAGSLTDRAPIGAAVIPTDALREEGTSFHYQPAAAMARPDPAALAAVRGACAVGGVAAIEGRVWTTDAPYRELTSKVERYARAGVVAVDMEASALFIVAAMRGVRLASLFVVSDELFHPWTPAFFDRSYRVAADRIAGCALEAATRLVAATGQRPMPVRDAE